MLYKFIQSEEQDSLKVFESIVINGSLKFSSALGFNDPFEFKFSSVAPSREDFDAWHKKYDRERSSDEIENGWSSFSGAAADWNTNFVPRQNLLRHLYILCMARRWDSHLMWAHYAGSYQGYVVIYHDNLVAEVAALPKFCGYGPVIYSTQVADLRWFQVPPNEMLGKVLLTKFEEWSYEKEFRLILASDSKQPAIYRNIDPSSVIGVIFGTRSPERIIDRALKHQQQRPGFIVQKITSSANSYALTTYNVDANSSQYGHML
jgi:hypothetical protein